jgi:hypothetical protein
VTEVPINVTARIGLTLSYAADEVVGRTETCSPSRKARAVRSRRAGSVVIRGGRRQNVEGELQ